MAKQLTIGLIGCGTRGKNILHDLQSLPVDVIVYEKPGFDCDTALKMGAKSCYISLHHIENVDGIIIATPAVTHKEILEQILIYHIPTFVEKPLTANFEDALSLYTLAHDEVFLMHNWRYHQGIELLGEIARNQELGKVLGIKTNRCNWTSPRTDIDSVWDLIPHDLTIVREILGEIPVPKFAAAEVHKGIARGMWAHLGEGPYCIIEISNRYWDKRREVRLHCEKGVAILKDEIVSHIEIIKGDHRSLPEMVDIEQRSFENYPPLLKELEVFLAHLQGGPPPKSNFAEGFEIIQIIDVLRKLAGIGLSK